MFGLNAPFGARCFLTTKMRSQNRQSPTSLNAPFGARCFLTRSVLGLRRDERYEVFMHLLALGAF